MKQALTERQAEVLAYIKRYIAEFGCAPSIRGIGERFDIQASAVFQHIQAIEAKGHLKRVRENGRAVHRGMVVVE